MKVITIGRSSDNDVVVNDSMVSRHHLQIIQNENGTFRLSDLQSANGTFVNGQKINGEAPLFNNDTVKIGNAVLPWQSYFEPHKKNESKRIPVFKKKKQLWIILSSVGVVCIAAIVVLASLFFDKYKSQNAVYIPKNAMFVASVDFTELNIKKDANIKYFVENNKFNKMLHDIEKESYYTAKLIREFTQDPQNASGINFTKKIYGFIEVKNKGPRGGIIAAIHKEKFEKNITTIMYEISPNIELRERNGIKFYEDVDIVFGWDEKTCILLTSNNRSISFSELEECFTRNKQESIVSNSGFKEFEKNSKFFNLLASSNFIKEIDDKNFQKTLRTVEDYSGWNISNNYLYFYYDMRKNHITVSATLKYNESFQKMDFYKIQRNQNRIMEAIDDYFNTPR